MIIDREISKYLVFSQDSLTSALNKINLNNSRIVFLVEESGFIEGIINDGDFRRWIVEQPEINMDVPAYTVSNKEFISCNLNEKAEVIEGLFSEKVTIIPLLDKNNRIVAVAKNLSEIIQIKETPLGDEYPSYIIAEIGNNHNGSLDIAKNIVDAAVTSGANCAKFQMRNISTLYTEQALNDSADLGVEYTLNLLKKFQLSNEELFEAFDYCKEKKITPLCTPWDVDSVDQLEEYGMPAYKVASADLTNHPLLEKIINTKKPIICSTGMSTESEILETIKLLKRGGAQYILLHCNSTYPAPFKDINLTYLEHLKEISGSIVGYSGHERGIEVPIAAIALGAKVIEKHITLDKNMEGIDHKVSLLPDEFHQMVQSIRNVEESMQLIKTKKLSQGEIMNRENLAKSIVAVNDICKGVVVERNMLDFKSPGSGLQPMYISQLVGQVTNRDIAKGELFYHSDINGDGLCSREYEFDIKWGIPVRYHDYKSLCKDTQPPLLEFHLSYKDLELKLEDYFSSKIDSELVVHCPELFSNDHILDLCSTNREYRRRSIVELQNVVNTTNDLKEYFNLTKVPLIVTNVGGFTYDNHLNKGDKKEFYTLLKDSLSQIDSNGVEIIPQTMPPFPWHFGGQRYHNIFVFADEISEFCSENNLRICMDVSHSKLACNHHGWSFEEFLNKLAPYVAHLHIADAEGVDGEGVQLGDGGVDFYNLFEVIYTKMNSVTFIPEIWQGHKNNGEGFWSALDKLEMWSDKVKSDNLKAKKNG